MKQESSSMKPLFTPFLLLGLVAPASLMASPYPADAPWPVFRGDSKNTGRSHIIPAYRQTQPWYFRTEKGIFSTPVIDGDETIYVGSADRYFYALNADGSVKWSLQTGEIIDSAAALTERQGERFITVPSGDGHLYHLSLQPGYANTEDRILWKFDASQHRHEKDMGYDWFEGNVVAGPDGHLYAGNTNWNYYKLDPDTGALLWRYPTNNMNWSAGAFDDAGNVYWTSLDLQIRKVDPVGQATLWKKTTLGFVSASVALGSDDTAYVGSFDNKFYALDTRSGKTRWSFQTTDHIYGSAALGVDAAGQTNAIYFTSADGHLYRVSPQGQLQWKFEVGDVIRSSPAVGPAPEVEARDIVYFGAANGYLYAINSDDGSLRWAYDTTQYTAELRDRNDLNASPALGQNGVYIAGEHGYVWHIPYDYPLHHPEDQRVIVEQPHRDNGAEVRFASSGGSTLDQDAIPVLPAAALINTELLVRQDGQRLDAGFHINPAQGMTAASLLNLTPFHALHIEPSADAHYLHVVPRDFLMPDTDYQIALSGEYMWDGLRIGSLEIGAKHYDRFADTLRFRTAPALSDRLPLTVNDDAVSAFELRRLSVPNPSMMTSLNQIGFDSYDWIVGTVEIDDPDSANRGRFITWSIGGQPDADGPLVPYRGTEFMFPMTGRYQNDAFILENRNLQFEVSGIQIPFRHFEMRGQMRDDFTVMPGAAVYAEVSPFNDPVYGPLLAAGGLVNKNMKVVASGTYLTRALPADHRTATRPENVRVSRIDYVKPTLSAPGRVTVTLDQDGQYRSADHLTSILLVDDSQGEPVWLNYRLLTEEVTDATGALRQVILHLPKGTPVPGKPRAVVMTDVFPLHQAPLQSATFMESLIATLLNLIRSWLP
jgi:outer membrane protein assembly factor BamB